MDYLKIGDTLYPASFKGIVTDREWGNRHSISVTLNMSHAEAAELFVDGLAWATFSEETETDMSEFEVAGPITDNRDGTMTVKMGKFTDADALAVLTGEV